MVAHPGRVRAAEPQPDAPELLETAENAEAARQADPTAANWRAEAQAKEALGNYAGAQSAYRGEADTYADDELANKRRAEADWERMREQARGRVDDEPRSTHRAQFDRKWVPAVPPPTTARPSTEQQAPIDTADDRIITKWYFWVTVAAIAASAGAVVGIAIQAARDERSDALDASFGLRF